MPPKTGDRGFVMSTALDATRVSQSAQRTEGRKTLTVEEFAKLAGIHRGGAYEGVRRGIIPHVRIGRRILIPTDALDRMLGRADEAG